jgi:hypothetical protein
MGKKEQADEKRSPWEPTRYQHLFRYVSSGVIFARFKIGGKQVRRSLKTANLELAKNKLTEVQLSERAVVEEQNPVEELVSLRVEPLGGGQRDSIC